MGELIERRWLLQVNRIFRDAVHASPLIQHKIDLFAAGLEYNAAAGISFADSKNSFLQYRSGLDTLCPIKKRTVNARGFNSMSGGVCAVIGGDDSIRLFTLGSASRGIPHKQWEIPSPVTDPTRFDFYPGADVIVFVETTRGADVRSP